MARHLNSKSLLPFSTRRNGFRLPGTDEEDENRLHELDPALKPEEEGYVRHYLALADVLLNTPDTTPPLKDREEREGVITFPKRDAPRDRDAGGTCGTDDEGSDEEKAA